MAFLPSIDDWIQARVQYVPNKTATFCGNLKGCDVLDIGCGDMIADVGLLSLNPNHITGMDVLEKDWDVKEHAAAHVRNAGFHVPSDYASRLSYVTYDGTSFPFPDNHFDLVFSWAVFEHVPDVPAVLREARRVVKPEGRVFIVVYPWFQCYAGSHLSDFIEEPYFHLTRSREWVHGRLKEFVSRNPSKESDVLGHLWQEYNTLNGYSARMFLAAAMDAGLTIERLESHTDEEHANCAPATIPAADVITTGTTVLFHPAKPPFSATRRPSTDAPESSLREEILALRTALQAERRHRDEIERSISWRITRPGREVVSLLAKAIRTR